MNIWEWVHEAVRDLRQNGHERLAELVDDVSSACCDGQHDRVENIVPEALALARASRCSSVTGSCKAACCIATT